jgi:regulatory protein
MQIQIGSKEKDLFLKLSRFCAYQDRAISEVKKKMYELDINLDMQNRLIDALIEENFLNERRFALSFTFGKFRNKSWGKNKIYRALLVKRVKKEDIEFALLQIDEEVYHSKIVQIIEKQNRVSFEKNILIKRKKIADYLQRKGFELPLVWEILQQELSN